MANELTSNPAPDAPQGQADGQAEGTPDSTGKAPVDGTSQNWQDSPEYRQMQRTWQAKQDGMAQELQHKEQRLQELEERGLDDFEKRGLQIQRLTQAVQQRDGYIAGLQKQNQVQAQIDADLTFISSKFEVPVHELRSAETYDEAMDLAKVKFEERIAAKYAPQEEDEQPTKQSKPQAHRPFLGESKPTGKQSSIEKKIDEAETTIDLMRLWYDTGD